jgi:hypothetical protein
MAAFEPYMGESKGRAWDAAAALLRSGDWMSRDEVVEAMVAASGLLRKSCEQVITSALHEGWLRRGLNLTIRTTPAGVMLREELRSPGVK